jgi:hypothetical protein
MVTSLSRRSNYCPVVASLLRSTIFVHNRSDFAGSGVEFIMSRRFALSATIAAAVLTCAPVHAEQLRPIQAQKVDLGALAGIAYYTVEPDGDRLVLTLQTPQSGTPFRVVATLAPGQTVTLSVPRKIGEPSIELHFIRRSSEQVWMNRGDAP